MRVKQIEIPSYSLNNERLISRVVYYTDGTQNYGYVEGVIVREGVETRLTYTSYDSHESLDQVLEYLK